MVNIGTEENQLAKISKLTGEERNLKLSKGNAAENGEKKIDETAEEIVISEANTNEDVVEIVINDEGDNIDDVVELTKKYKFEGKIIDKIDMSPYKEFNAMDALKVDKLYRKTTKNISSSPEMTIDYAIAAASIVTGLPVEFFMRLNVKDITKIKLRIVNFIYGD